MAKVGRVTTPQGWVSWSINGDEFYVRARAFEDDISFLGLKHDGDEFFVQYREQWMLEGSLTPLFLALGAGRSTANWEGWAPDEIRQFVTPDQQALYDEDGEIREMIEIAQSIAEDPTATAEDMDRWWHLRRVAIYHAMLKAQWQCHLEDCHALGVLLSHPSQTEIEQQRCPANA